MDAIYFTIAIMQVWIPVFAEIIGYSVLFAIAFYAVYMAVCYLDDKRIARKAAKSEDQEWDAIVEAWYAHEDVFPTEEFYEIPTQKIYMKEKFNELI